MLPSLISIGFLLIHSTSAPLSDEPSAFLSGMDLLYGNRISVYQKQEPIVPVGIMDGQRELTFSSTKPLRLDYYEKGVHKTTQVSPNLSVKIRLHRVQAANREHYIDLEGTEWKDTTRLKKILAKWQKRGFERVKALEEGTVFGLAGSVIDNRGYRVVLPVTSRKEARQTISKLFAQWNHRAQARSRITERPWGELVLMIDGFQIATATSYIRINPEAPETPTTLHSVQYGKGYKWGGREDREYRGNLYAVVDPNGRLAAVNAIPVETILAGVVPSELFASAHPEALKAQAVAARTILFAQLSKRHYADPYHLCSSQHCQVYGGASHEDPRTTHAVDSTSGELLFHNNKLLNATYSSTCGGFTEHNDAVWRTPRSEALRGKPDFPLDDPSLAAFQTGIKPDNFDSWLQILPESYCKKATQAQENKLRWTREFSGSQLQELISKRYPHLGRITDIHVLKRGISGRAMSLRLTGTKASTVVLYELPIRRLFNNLRSAAFILNLDRVAGVITKATFKGSGWGHGVGMCQLGAIGRAEAHQSYKTILAHYYGGAKLRRLYPPKIPPSRSNKKTGPTNLGMAPAWQLPPP